MAKSEVETIIESPLETELGKHKKLDEEKIRVPEEELKKISEKFDASFEARPCFGNVYACIDHHHNGHILKYFFTRHEDTEHKKYFELDQIDKEKPNPAFAPHRDS